MIISSMLTDGFIFIKVKVTHYYLLYASAFNIIHTLPTYIYAIFL